MSFKVKNNSKENIFNKVILKNSSNSSSSSKSINDTQTKKDSDKTVNQGNQVNQTISQVDCDENTKDKNVDTKLLISTYNSNTKTSNLRNLSDSSSNTGNLKIGRKGINKNEVEGIVKPKAEKYMNTNSNAEKLTTCDKCSLLKKEIESLKEENKKLKIEIKKLKVQALNEINERNKLKAIISSQSKKNENDAQLITSQKEEIYNLTYLKMEVTKKYEELMNLLGKSNNQEISTSKKESNDISNSNINDYQPITFNKNDIKINLGGHIFLDFAERAPLDITQHKDHNENDNYIIKTTITKDLSVFNDEYSIDDYLNNILN